MLIELESTTDTCKEVQVGFSAGAHYVNYLSEEELLLKSFSNRSLHQQIKFIFQLDNKAVHQFGCNTKGAVIVHQKFVPVTGGGLLTITGACFGLLNKTLLTCKYEHTVTTGRIIGDSNTALCPLPLFNRLGKHVLWLSVDNGETYHFHTEVNIVPEIYRVPDVIVTDMSGSVLSNNLLIANRTYNITLRNGIWNDHYEVYLMMYNSHFNKWKYGKRLTQSFKFQPFDKDKVSPTIVSVIRVAKIVNGSKVEYSSSLFTILKRDDMKKVCQNWKKRDVQKAGTLLSVIPCPCTLADADSNVLFEDDIKCTSQETHPYWSNLNCKTNTGAYKCVISKSIMYNGAGQQCCYDSNGVLITNSTGRGTIRKTSVHADNYISHFEDDYFPYLICCPDSCDVYYKRRETDNCFDYIS